MPCQVLKTGRGYSGTGVCGHQTTRRYFVDGDVAELRAIGLEPGFVEICHAHRRYKRLQAVCTELRAASRHLRAAPKSRSAATRELAKREMMATRLRHIRQRHRIMLEVKGVANGVLMDRSL